MSSFSRKLSCFLVFAAAGCGRHPAPPVLTPATPLPHESPNPAVRDAEFRKDSAAFQENLEALKYDVESYQLRGQISEKDPTPTLKAEVSIRLELLESQEILTLNSDVSRVLSVNDGRGAQLKFEEDHDRQKLAITLPTDLQAAGTSLELKIAYEVEVGRDTALKFVPIRKGDPVSVPVFYTSSEPQEAHHWMPCQDRPDDRAKFGIEISMDSNESLISNGLKVKDLRTRDSRHVMAYETQNPLPTYVMAFAVGNFESKIQKLPNGKEISVWARRGVPVDFGGVLKATVDQIHSYETLLIPYPWEKYAIVLLPELGGGMENISITFNDETNSSQGSYGGDWSLMAHELGHQWFGDFVTVKGWNDLWIKEGMATLLAAESTRAFEDKRSSGRAMGRSYWFVAGQAIYDDALPPDEKYTSGPYDRAAWLLTQIRVTIGEKLFWSTLREVLQTHALASISTEEFIGFFAKHMSAEASDRVRSALLAKAVPSTQLHGSPGVPTTIAMRDPDKSLLQPLTFDKVNAASGVSESFALGGLGGLDSAELSPTTDGSYWIVDSKDSHPDFSAFIEGNAKDNVAIEQKNFRDLLTPHLIPGSRSSFDHFSELPGYKQSLALAQTEFWVNSQIGSSEQFEKLLSTNSTESNRVFLASIFCGRASKNPSESISTPQWKSLAISTIDIKTYLGLSSWSPKIENCADIAGTHFKKEIQAIALRIPKSSTFEARLSFLSQLNFSAQDGFAMWTSLMERAPSVRNRETAVDAFVKSLKEVLGERAPSQDTRDKWLNPLRRLLSQSRLRKVLASSIAGLVEAKDTTILPQLTEIALDDTALTASRVTASCAAFNIEPSSFDNFRSQVSSSGKLPTEVQDVLANPNQHCAH